MREGFNDRGPESTLLPLCYFHRRPENVLTYTPAEKSVRTRRAIATKLDTEIAAGSMLLQRFCSTKLPDLWRIIWRVPEENKLVNSFS